MEIAVQYNFLFVNVVFSAHNISNQFKHYVWNKRVFSDYDVVDLEFMMFSLPMTSLLLLLYWEKAWR